MARFFVNRPIVAMVIAIIMVYVFSAIGRIAVEISADFDFLLVSGKSMR